MGIILVLFVLFINGASTLAHAQQCPEMVKPVDVSEYAGTSNDFNKGFSTLYRDKYIDTTTTYFEGIGSHPGVDITHGTNGQHFTTSTPVFAICAGIVERVTENGKNDNGWGNSLTIRHDVPGLGTVYSVYAHLDRFTRRFSKNDLVSYAEQIGFVGSTGNSSGIHLHFQIDNSTPSTHPFFPNRFNQPNDAALEVNTPDNDGLVASRTFSPLNFVQEREQPQTGWLSFLEGNPGIPGDGMLINAAGGSSPSAFEFITPVYLSGLTDGFTVTVFFPPTIQDFGSIGFCWDISRTCQFTPCQTQSTPGYFTGKTIFNGVEGYFTNIPQSTLQSLVDWLNPLFPGCDITINNLSIIWLGAITSQGINIFTLDAATILPGQNAVP